MIDFFRSFLIISDSFRFFAWYSLRFFKILCDAFRFFRFFTTLFFGFFWILSDYSNFFRIIPDAFRLFQIFSKIPSEIVKTFKLFSSTHTFQVFTDPFISSKMFHIFLDFSRFFEMLSDSPKFSQISSDPFRFFPNLTISLRFPQIFSDCLRFLQIISFSSKILWNFFRFS